MAEGAPNEDVQPRWWLIFLLAAIGILLIIAGAAIATTSEKDYAGSILVHFGSTLFLAEMIVLLERRFTKSVTRSLNNADRVVAEAVDGAATEAGALFQDRLAEMDARIARLREAGQEEAKAAVSTMDTSVSAA